MCEGTSFIKEGDFFVCQACGMKYPAEELKKLVREETESKAVSLSVPHTPDNNGLLDKHIANARRAKDREDWEDAERYYNKAEEIDPDHTEAVFYSSYAKLMIRLRENDFFKREAAAKVLKNEMRLLAEKYAPCDIEIIRPYHDDILKLYGASFVHDGLSNKKSETEKLLALMLLFWIEMLNSISEKAKNDVERRETFLMAAEPIKILSPKVHYLEDYIPNGSIFEEKTKNKFVSLSNKIDQWLCTHDKNYLITEIEEIKKEVAKTLTSAESQLDYRKVRIDEEIKVAKSEKFCAYFWIILGGYFSIALIGIPLLQYGLRRKKEIVAKLTKLEASKNDPIEVVSPEYAKTTKRYRELINIYTTYYADDAKAHPEITNANFVDKQV